ncbi:hypothetical protein B6S12_09745 [Helicobacter valdiviensis]|uniref:Uncharacterized protein n=1 Tax=Helicobacter valdiviensis TaxID=1458358 RepID=A0A2W6NIX6_9HELI|nr:hypothetical protein [Helicobacter valdiviensis]PZT47306.1 hypothetical protein B6S12_09745 [Helicobacter valdiviensis]
MTKNQEIYRKQLLCKIHTHPRYKNIKQNEAWEDFLYYRFSVNSSKELSINELKILLDILEGKRKDELNLAIDFKGRAMLLSNAKSQKQEIYLKALLEELDMPLLSFYLLCKKTLKKTILKLEDLNKKDTTIMIMVCEKILKTRTLRK